jgi:hypothetical protein
MFPEMFLKYWPLVRNYFLLKSWFSDEVNFLICIWFTIFGCFGGSSVVMQIREQHQYPCRSADGIGLRPVQDAALQLADCGRSHRLG